MTIRIDIGEGHSIEIISAYGKDVGLLDYHKKPNGSDCLGSIFWDATFQTDPNKLWTLENGDREHITVSPSLACGICGDHGFIKDGKWIKA